MAEDIGDDLCQHAGAERNRGESVTQPMRCQLRQSRALDGPSECLANSLRRDRAPILLCEDKIEVGPELPGSETFRDLPLRTSRSTVTVWAGSGTAETRAFSAP